MATEPYTIEHMKLCSNSLNIRFQIVSSKEKDVDDLIGGGEAGTGNIVEAVRHEVFMGDIRLLSNMDEDEVFAFAKKIQAPYDLVMQTKLLGRLPVVHFAAVEVATPADAALMMQLGCDGVFVGSSVFKSGDPARRARAIIQAVTHYSEPEVLAEVSCGLGEATVGINLNDEKVERFASRSE